MDFIIFDLEFNQNPFSLQNFDRKCPPYPFEIIQIGAIKLDMNLNTIATFNSYVKPTFYAKIDPFITKLTGISVEQLQKAQPFPAIYEEFTKFIGGTDSVLCTWGMADIKGLFKNVEYHQLSNTLLPKLVINLQPYVSVHFKQSRKNLLGLQHAVELLNIPVSFSFHDAFHDAFYTSEVFNKIYRPSIQPQPYDPYLTIRSRQRKRKIDTDKLLSQFEKMYAREMTEEEQGMIILAYKMGRTNQFLVP